MAGGTWNMGQQDPPHPDPIHHTPPLRLPSDRTPPVTRHGPRPRGRGVVVRRCHRGTVRNLHQGVTQGQDLQLATTGLSTGQLAARHEILRQNRWDLRTPELKADWVGGLVNWWERHICAYQANSVHRSILQYRGG